MEYTFVCKFCGYEATIDEKDLLSSRKLICQRCLRESGVRVTQSGRTASASKYRNVTLSPEQERAASYHDGANAVLVIGPAGSGKTNVLVERALYLLQEVHVPVSNLTILTHSCRAAWSIAKRLGYHGVHALHEVRRPAKWCSRAYTGPDIDNEDLVSVSSFYSFCLDLMEYFCGFYFSSEPGCEDWAIEDKKLIDRDDQCAVIGKLRNELGLSGKTLSALVPEAEELRGIFTCISNSMIGVEEYYRRRPPAHTETVDLVKTLAGMYAKYKNDNEEIDIDDILAITAGALKNSTDFRTELAKEYLHILVDDVQEVTPVEWTILQAICPPSTLFCTGDDAQGICSSEGADFRTMREFDRMFPGSVTFRLTENFRSAPEIAELPDALLKASDLEYDATSTTHIAEAGHKPELHTFPSEREEADFVLESVRGKLKEGVPPGEITLLFRTADQAQVMERTLRSARIPYRFIGGTSFLQKPHVKDFFSVVDALNDIYNEAAWRRFIGLHPGLGKSVPTLIRGMRKNLAKNKNDMYYAYDNARRWLSDKLTATDPKLSYFLKWPPTLHFVTDHMTEILKYLTDTGLLRNKYDKWAERKKDLQLLIRLTEEYAYATQTDHGTHAIGDRFIKEFKLDSDTIVQEFDQNAAEKLTLATVHGARHIESDFCYLFRVQDGVYPLEKASSPESIEEERRVLYVAMTRARKELILTQTAGESSMFLTQAMSRKEVAGQSERNDNNGVSSSVW